MCSYFGEFYQFVKCLKCYLQLLNQKKTALRYNEVMMMQSLMYDAIINDDDRETASFVFLLMN